MSSDSTPARRRGPMLAALRGPAITARDQELIAEHRAHQSSSSARNGQPSSAGPSRRFRCPFADCSRSFNHEKDLKTHKIAEHDYCKICDLDFKDDEAFHVHKMQSEKHITCPMCSVDFQSESGRNRHFKQMHIQQQNIKCRGCQEVFPRGGGLMMHLETNSCTANGFNNPTLQQNRAMMEVHMDGVTQLMREDSEAGAFSVGTSAAGDTAGGGVLLDEPYDVLNEEDEDQTKIDSVHPALAVRNAFDDSDSDGDFFTTKSAGGAPTESNAPSSVWPLLKKEKKTKTKEPEDATKILENMTFAEPAWSKRLFPNASKNPGAPGYHFPIRQETHETINPVSGERNNFPVLDLKIDPIDNLYHCPFPKCEVNGADRKKVEEHLASGAHRAAREQCPGCLRRFNGAAALVQHMESASERCRIKESRHFGNAMTIVSGGYLAVTGFHSDGTVKLEDPNVQW